jgi:radical SAM superfamily enzyme YgiQ (UPF0313 family)
MKVLIIQANDEEFNEFKGPVKQRKRCAYAPLTLTQLAALVPEELNAKIKIVDEGIQELPKKIEADIVGISATTPNAHRAYKIADRLRAEGKTVVLGGYHATLMPEEAAQHADAIVLGYAEKSWPQLLHDFKNNNLQPRYDCSGQEVFEQSLPVPRRDLLNQRSYLIKNTIEATRGCPNLCEFCVIAAAHGREHWLRPVEEVVEEIKQMKAKRVVFLDSSPTEFSDYAKDLCRALIPLKIKWSSAATMRIARDKEWLQLAFESGLEAVLIGFESLSQDSLMLHRKGFNKVDEFAETAAMLHDHNVAILGCFVLGLEEDDISVFQKTVDFVNQAKIDIVQYAVYTPFPGTPVFERLDKQGRILTRDWQRYNGKNVVFQPAKMTVKELQHGFFWANKETYRMRSIRNRIKGVRFARRFRVRLGNYAFRFLTRSFLPKEIIHPEQVANQNPGQPSPEATAG